jgi:uncharacterized protein YfaT (DUF1175 family)
VSEVSGPSLYWIFLGECAECKIREHIGSVRVRADGNVDLAAMEVLRDYRGHWCPACGVWNTYGPRDLIVVTAESPIWPAAREGVAV